MLWLLHRVLEAFTKPSLQRSAVDEFLIGAAALLTVALLGCLWLLAWRTYLFFKK
jgi:hypothetical protein